MSAPPDRLYHGSPVQGLAEIVPARKSVRDPEEGAAVFAAPDAAIATVFASNTGSYHCGYFDDVPYAAFLEDDRARVDAPGSLYVLSAATFSFDDSKGMGPREWTSSVPVVPLEERRLPSVLDALIDRGVVVHFLDRATWDAIGTSKDHGLAIFSRMTSENERRGLDGTLGMAKKEGPKPLYDQ